MMHPAKEAEVVSETLVVLGEAVLLAITMLCKEKMSVMKVALVTAVVVVVHMVAMGMAIMGLVIMEEILEVVKATVILAITTISLQILD